MRLLQAFGLALAQLALGTLLGDIEISRANFPSADSPWSNLQNYQTSHASLSNQAYDVSSTARLNGTMRRDTECKSCPYGNCLNVGLLFTDMQVQFQCFTQGAVVGGSKTWLRYQFAARQEDFCYVHTFDLQPYNGDFVVDLPYCGTKSELNLYLPSQKIKTIYYTECSLCPYRDCEGIKYYQSGTELDVNCEILDGWNQLGPLHPEGTKKYYRTPDNCYVSIQNVDEIPARVINVGLVNPVTMDVLPPCGPVPHIRVADRPGLDIVDDAFIPSRPLVPAAAKRDVRRRGRIKEDKFPVV